MWFIKSIQCDSDNSWYGFTKYVYRNGKEDCNGCQLFKRNNNDNDSYEDEIDVKI